MTIVQSLDILTGLDAQDFLTIYDGNSDEVPRKLLKKWISKAERLNNIEKTRGHEALKIELNKYNSKNRKRSLSINSNSSIDSTRSNNINHQYSLYREGISYADMLKSNI